MPRTLSRDAEADRILREYESRGFETIMSMLERQFLVLHNRAQVLLALCGIIISTTGFSGRIIAGTSRLAQVLIVGGVGLTLLSAMIVAWGVLHLRWLTMQPGQSLRDWLLASLRYRDVKTRAYRVGLIVALVGITLYCGSIALMLLDPLASNLSPR